MKELSKAVATWHEIGDEAAGQRIDNYLARQLKGVPKSHIYRILRGGEVRVNGRRVAPHYRLAPGDRVRIPPLRAAAPARARERAAAPPLGAAVLYEDELLLAIDKPAGVAAHGGSGVAHGVIERVRAERPALRFLELVHRLDRDTSGVLMLAKRRSALLELHRQLREGRVRKLYLALVKGEWREGRRSVELPLAKRVLVSGERRVSVSGAGRPARTLFRLRRAFPGFSLLEAEIATGRTHQIRVHLAHLGFPIAGDDKYGDFALNRELARQGLRRMFLHAHRTVITHPRTGQPLALEAPLPEELSAFLRKLEAGALPSDHAG